MKLRTADSLVTKFDRLGHSKEPVTNEAEVESSEVDDIVNANILLDSVEIMTSKKLGIP